VQTFIDVLLFLILTWIELGDVVNNVAAIDEKLLEQTHNLMAERKFGYLKFLDENEDCFCVIENTFHIFIVEMLRLFPLSSIFFQHFFNVLLFLLLRTKLLLIGVSDLLLIGLLNFFPTALERVAAIFDELRLFHAERVKEVCFLVHNSDGLSLSEELHPLFSLLPPILQEYRYCGQ